MSSGAARASTNSGIVGVAVAMADLTPTVAYQLGMLDRPQATLNENSALAHIS